MPEKGSVAPTWPSEFGGGGLGSDKALVLNQQMERIKVAAPSSGMGLTMIGPTFLEFGTEEQKHRHIPSICDGSIRSVRVTVNLVRVQTWQHSRQKQRLTEIT